ncbi:MAG: hypothetical protein KF777_22645 [Planctomycetaceae bacterium]|nr:hypothetical protein [Planctomycetaceae bacterium]
MRKTGTPGMRTSRIVLAVVFGLSIRAATCEDRPLLDLLPLDTAAVIHLDSPGQAWSELRETPFWQRVEESTLYQTWQAGSIAQKWASVQDYSRKQTGRSVSEHFLAVAGEEAAFALFLPDGGDPQGVLLTRATDPRTVTAFLDDWNRLEGDARLEPAVEGRSYFRRVRSGSNKPLFVLRSGTILAISDQEGVISDLESRLLATTTDSFARTPHEKRLRSAFAPQARLTLSINPSRWKALLRGNAGDENAGMEWLSSRVDALEAIGVSLRAMGAKAGAAPSERTCLELELIVRTSESLASSHSTTVRRSWPATTVLAASGTLVVADWWPLIRRVSSEPEQAEWQKVRRVGRGILGGEDPVPSLLGDRPVLLEGLIFASPDRGLDGRLSAVFADSSTARRDRWIRVIRLIGQLLTIDQNRHANRPEVVMHDEAVGEMTRFWIDGASLVWFPTVTAALDQIIVDSHPDSAKTPVADSRNDAVPNATVVPADPALAAIQAGEHPLLFVWWNAAALRNHLRTTDVATIAWERRDQTLIGLPVLAAAAVFQMTDLFDRAQLGVRVDGETARARVILEVDSVAAP